MIIYLSVVTNTIIIHYQSVAVFCAEAPFRKHQTGTCSFIIQAAPETIVPKYADQYGSRAPGAGDGDDTEAGRPGTGKLNPVAFCLPVGPVFNFVSGLQSALQRDFMLFLNIFANGEYVEILFDLSFVYFKMFFERLLKNCLKC